MARKITVKKSKVTKNVPTAPKVSNEYVTAAGVTPGAKEQAESQVASRNARLPQKVKEINNIQD